VSDTTRSSGLTNDWQLNSFPVGLNDAEKTKKELGELTALEAKKREEEKCRAKKVMQRQS